MDRDGLRVGHLVALGGAALLLVALWLPWFAVHLEPGERQALTGAAGQLGTPFAAFAEGFLAQVDGLRVTAWEAFGGEDVALASGAGAVVAVIAAAAGGAGAGVRVEPVAAARLATLAGVGLGGLVLVRLLHRPLGGRVLDLAVGGKVALAGCALMAVGGVLGQRRPRRPAPAWPADPVVVAPAVPVAGSVAPPG